MDISQRPRPIFAKFKTIGGGLSVAAGALTSLVTLGALHQAEADSINGVLVGAAGLVSLVITLLGQFGIVKASEPLVTPMSDPRTDDGTALVPIATGGRVGGLEPPRGRLD